MRTVVIPRQGDSPLTRDMWWCTCGRGICDGREIPGYPKRGVRWRFCPHCGSRLAWPESAASQPPRFDDELKTGVA